MKRKIVKIDESKCTGCGLCIPGCHEGALQIVDGKAKIVKEVYCDGLGTCLGTCPEDAITIEERDADAFDPIAVEEHLKQKQPKRRQAPAPCPGTLSFAMGGGPLAGAFGGGCPGAAALALQTAEAPADDGDGEATPSQLRNWPLQLHLVPVNAPYFDDARLLIAADCTAFALPDFHRRALAGKIALIGCPKLDETDTYREKLAAIFRQNAVRDVEVLHMEVPCCHALTRLVADALEASGKEIPLTTTQVGIGGEVQRQG